MYIIFEGCISSGKTTLVQLLGNKIKGKILLEATNRHPFIRDFYDKPSEYAFQTEMNFILIHYHQLQKAKLSGWFEGEVVSDFLFDKDLLFANLTLKKNKVESKLFRRTFGYLKAKIPEPDLTVYLKAPTDFLIKRIKRRGRRFEENIPFEYLNALNNKYDKFFNKYPQNKTITLDITELDWQMDKRISKEKIATYLLKLIKKKIRL